MLRKLSICMASIVFGMASQICIAASYSPQHDKVETLFRGKTEPTAKDALWTSVSIFKVGVLDDGRSRDGYASYICESLYDNGFKGKKVWVQVVDIVKLKKTGKWIKLGEAHCK